MAGALRRYTAEATRFEGSNTARLSISGGIGALGGYVFASREITESFGVVRVADYDDVRVLLENQPAARTSGGGYAVLPRLRAYDLNQIGIAQESLPLDATIGRLKVDAVPSYRSGVLIDFPVTRSRGATVTILLADGSPMPVGAVAVIDGADVVFPVGEGGLAYLSGLAANNRITVRHRGERCSFELPYPSTDDPLPDLGMRGLPPARGSRAMRRRMTFVRATVCVAAALVAQQVEAVACSASTAGLAFGPTTCSPRRPLC